MFLHPLWDNDPGNTCRGLQVNCPIQRNIMPIQNLHDFTIYMSNSFALTVMSTLTAGHYHQKRRLEEQKDGTRKQVV